MTSGALTNVQEFDLEMGHGLFGIRSSKSRWQWPGEGVHAEGFDAPPSANCQGIFVLFESSFSTEHVHPSR